ncbi:MAG: site-specific integrase [Muribaculaceae bacterium]|nr:site-specific integrase [Muribaculaceae bacterium]
MANTRLFLDMRRVKEGEPSALKVAIAHHKQTAYILLDVKLFPYQWDNHKAVVINHPNETYLNIRIQSTRVQVERILLVLGDSGRLAQMTAAQVRAQVEEELRPEKAEQKKREKDKDKLFAARFMKFADSQKASTRRLYVQTLKRMKAYAGAKLERLAFEDVDREWILGFDNFLAQTSPSRNARNIHLRNIRAVFNAAIDDEITVFYPFRRLKIKNEATRKRNLKVEDFRKFINCPCDAKAQKHLDMFKLMFMLIGINLVDLCNLKEIDNNGRINYHRAKTNRLYSIKVEPEALEIINKYRGKNYLIDILDRYKDYHDYTKRINLALKQIGPYKRVGRGGKKTTEPMFPDISTYWARHSWATIAASLDIPRDTIAHALGHGNNTVTDIYIDFDERKVDEANRKVLDWVLYGKK